MAGKKKLLLKSLLGVALLLWLFNVLDWRQAFRLLRAVDPLILSFNFLLFPVGLSIVSLRWQGLLKPFNLRASFPELLKGYWIGVFASNFMPSNIGGDISRIGLLYKYGMPAQVAASVVAERLSGLVVLIGLSITAILCRPTHFNFEGFFIAYWSFVGLFVLVLLVTAVAGGVFATWVEKYLTSKKNFYLHLFGKFRKLFDSLVLYRDNPFSIVMGLCFSALYYFQIIVVHYLLVLALGFVLPFKEVFFIVPMINLVSMIPVSFNAIGLAEGAFVLFYSRVGLSPEQALAMALLARIIQILCSSAGGLFLLTGKATFFEKNKDV